MLYREIIAVCSQIHTKHINTQCGQNVELLNVKPAVHIVTTGLQRVNIVDRNLWCVGQTDTVAMLSQAVAAQGPPNTHTHLLCFTSQYTRYNGLLSILPHLQSWDKAAIQK